MSATSLGPPTQGGGSFPRRVMVMKSRGVGFLSPECGEHPVPMRLGAAEAGELGVGERLVERLRAEIEVAVLRQQHQRSRPRAAGVSMKRELVLGLRLGRGHHGMAKRGDLHVLGIAAEAARRRP